MFYYNFPMLSQSIIGNNEAITIIDLVILGNNQSIITAIMGNNGNWKSTIKSEFK